MVVKNSSTSSRERRDGDEHQAAQNLDSVPRKRRRFEDTGDEKSPVPIYTVSEPTPPPGINASKTPDDIPQDIENLQKYVSQMNENNAKLAGEKAKAIREKADYHRRLTVIHAQQATMMESIAKRVKEKDVEIQRNAELVQANAELRIQNVVLVQDIVGKDTKIRELEKQLEDLPGLQKENGHLQEENNHLQARIEAILKDIREEHSRPKRSRSQAPYHAKPTNDRGTGRYKDEHAEKYSNTSRKLWDSYQPPLREQDSVTNRPMSKDGKPAPVAPKAHHDRNCSRI